MFSGDELPYSWILVFRFYFHLIFTSPPGDVRIELWNPSFSELFISLSQPLVIIFRAAQSHTSESTNQRCKCKVVAVTVVLVELVMIDPNNVQGEDEYTRMQQPKRNKTAGRDADSNC